MGRSKFPGKPSKLVNKKRVSVLHGVSGSPAGDNSNEDDADDQLTTESIFMSNDDSSTTTTISTSTTTTITSSSPSNITTTTTTLKSGHDGDAQVYTQHRRNKKVTTENVMQMCVYRCAYAKMRPIN